MIPLDTWTLFADKTGEPVKDEFPDVLHPNDYGYIKFAAALRPIFATLGFTETEPDYFTPEPGFESLFNGKDLTGWGLRPTSEADKESAKKWQASDPNAATWPFVTEAESFDGKTSSPDGRFQAINGRLVVTTPPEPRRIQQIWTKREFPKDFVLKLEFRATPNADSGVYLRGPQLQCRDYGLAGPFTNLHEVQAAGLERDDRDGAERRGDGDRERREARRRAEGAADRPDRPRRRSRTDGVPPHPDQDREVAPGCWTASASRIGDLMSKLVFAMVVTALGLAASPAQAQTPGHPRPHRATIRPRRRTRRAR